MSKSLEPDQDWVQTVCKGYQQRTKVTTGKERVNEPVHKILVIIPYGGSWHSIGPVKPKF